MTIKQLRSELDELSSEIEIRSHKDVDLDQLKVIHDEINDKYFNLKSEMLTWQVELSKEPVGHGDYYKIRIGIYHLVVALENLEEFLTASER